MQSTSVYTVTQAEPPTWHPGEEKAACAFIGIAIWLIFDTLFSVVRVFKEKRGLYFWSIMLGLIGLSIDALGVILKYLSPGTKHIWGFYTFCLLAGWAIYPVAQLMVLYSRLHLVNDVLWLRKVVLYTILSTYFTVVLPTWVLNWYSYNPDPKVTSVWSPRTAILERFTQIILTLVELTVCGTYIWSLLKILRTKVTVRQTRVMTDLIYVNIIAVSFDALTVIFICLNMLGISHPVQTFSYALKFKLEFVVLNQLMAVAARGIKRKSWSEKRYYDPNAHDGFSAEAQRWAEAPPRPHQGTEDLDPLESPPDYSGSSSQQRLSVPPRTAARAGQSSSPSPFPSPNPHIDPANPKAFDFHPEPKLNLRDSLIENGPADVQSSYPQSERPSEAFSGKTLQPSISEPREESPHLFPRQLHKRKRRTMELIREHVGVNHNHRNRESRPTKQQDQPAKQESKPDPRMNQGRSHFDFNPNLPQNATLRRPNPRKQSADDDDEEEIGVHMWERRGTILLCAPWMEKETPQQELQKQDV